MPHEAEEVQRADWGVVVVVLLVHGIIHYQQPRSLGQSLVSTWTWKLCPFKIAKLFHTRPHEAPMIGSHQLAKKT